LPSDPAERGTPNAALWISAALFVGFILLAILVNAGQLQDLDIAIVRLLATWRSPLVGFTGELFSLIGRGEVVLPLALLGALGAFLRGRRGLALALLLLLPITGVEVVSKHVVQVPDEGLAAMQLPAQRYLPRVTSPISISTPYTFPSGHAARLCFLTSLAVAVAIRRPANARLDSRREAARRAGLLATAAVVLALGGLTRVTEAQHLPSEVLGGYLLAGSLVGPALRLLELDRPS
jgi:undecaprenyl-diphosphatase